MAWRDRLDRLAAIRPPWLRRIDSWLLIAFLALAGATAIFLHLASEMVEGDTLKFDRWLLRSLRSATDAGVPAGPGWLNAAMVEITALGGTTVLTLVTLFAGAVLLARRKWALALFVMGTIAVAATANSALKDLFLRDRPNIVPHLVEVSSASFPSGHAMNSATVYLTLAALLAAAERSWRVRAVLMGGAVGLTLLIGFSRVYLGVHWPTDVLAGWTVGAAWAVASALIAHRLQQADRLEGAGTEIAPDAAPR